MCRLGRVESLCGRPGGLYERGVIMTRKLGLLMIVLGLALSVWAADAVPTGTISGTVRDSAGVVQMGATVQIFADALLPIATVLPMPAAFSMPRTQTGPLLRESFGALVLAVFTGGTSDSEPAPI